LRNKHELRQVARCAPRTLAIITQAERLKNGKERKKKCSVIPLFSFLSRANSFYLKETAFIMTN